MPLYFKEVLEQVSGQIISGLRFFKCRADSGEVPQSSRQLALYSGWL